MYATVRHYTDPELADRLRARAEEVAAVIAGIPGFRSYHLIHADDGTISVSVYDDEASAKASNEAAASWLSANMPGVTADHVAGGEVVFST
jgi:heme-degrading monooxygenase HmoA